AAFALKIGLREAIERRPPLAGLRRKGVFAGIAYLVLAIGFAGFYKPITRVNVGSPEYTYGYAVAWATEFLSYDADAVLDHAIATAAVKSRKLTEVETPLDFGRHIVVVQVESLDYDAIEATAGGQHVMPVLRSLKKRSMTYMVKPFHATGSSDADFALLTASIPNGRITPFKVVGFPFEESLPWLVERFGYTALAMHGNTGAFFQRRDAYERMGFSKLYFDQELDDCGVDGAYDDELLRFSARLIRESSVPMFHFVITWTSHGPFNKLPRDAEKIYPQPKSVDQRYMNSMRYVDRALEEYYRELPDDTTIVIYGDHHSRVQGYASGKAHKDRVPWIICRKGKNLAGQQATSKTGLATSGDLTQLDMACYLRDSLQTFATIASQERAKRNPH
ncbi:MAG: LTA synthase family protein, partial [Pirellulaceae bacterium]|nr:LTA synthase family protein [Pirellulaceae bacterium]